nr:hypothetical protein Iba_chr09cCG8940 [Ipomoea batatas]
MSLLPTLFVSSEKPEPRTYLERMSRNPAQPLYGEFEATRALHLHRAQPHPASSIYVTALDGAACHQDLSYHGEIRPKQRSTPQARKLRCLLHRILPIITAGLPLISTQKNPRIGYPEKSQKPHEHTTRSRNSSLKLSSPVVYTHYPQYRNSQSNSPSTKAK